MQSCRIETIESNDHTHHDAIHNWWLNRITIVAIRTDLALFRPLSGESLISEQCHRILAFALQSSQNHPENLKNSRNGPYRLPIFWNTNNFQYSLVEISSNEVINNADRLRRRMRCHPWIVSPLLRKDESIRGCWNALVIISTSRPMVKADFVNLRNPFRWRFATPPNKWFFVRTFFLLSTGEFLKVGLLRRVSWHTK